MTTKRMIIRTKRMNKAHLDTRIEALSEANPEFGKAVTDMLRFKSGAREAFLKNIFLAPGEPANLPDLILQRLDARTEEARHLVVQGSGAGREIGPWTADVAAGREGKKTGPRSPG